MKFFNKFPHVNYKFGSQKKLSEFTDLSRYADIIDQVKDDATVYQFYRVPDGARPDAISKRLYDNETYDWTFWILNDHIRDRGWPLGYQDFRDHLVAVLPGECLVVNDTDTHSETSITVHALTEQFPVGSSVYGTNTGASGTVYMRNLNLGQLFVTKNNDINFTAGEVIVDTLTGTPIYNATLSGRSLAYEAAHHYLDANNEIVDIDPTTGIVPGTYTEVTHEEFLQAENNDLAMIRVLKPSLVTRFVSLYKEAINR